MPEDQPRPDDPLDASPASGARRLSVASALLAAALVLLAWTVVVAVAGGFTLRAGILRLSSHKVLPPLLGFVLFALTARRAIGPRAEEAWSSLRGRLHALAPALAVLLVVVVVAVAVAYSSRVAADSDAYGYVSQAELWMKGRLVQHDPLASTLGTRFSPRLLAPLGYVPGEAQGTIVPLYPPGLPMAMAAAGRLFGPEAIHLVVPACGGLLVGLAYVLGQRLGDRFSGLATAGLVAAHPSFLLQAIQPMSDVPAAAAWTAALAFASRSGGPWPPLAAGLVASAAILIRPNLTPLAAAVALLAYLIDRPHGLRRVAAFAAGLVPGAMVLAAVNSALYGSPFLSGYGGAGDYLRVAHVPRNLVLYPRWLLETQGPLVFLSLLAPLAWLRSPLTESGERRPALPALVVFGGTLAAIYALYLPFEDWPYVRFLLPGLPLALVLALAPLRTCLRPFATALRVPLLVAVVAASFAWSLRFTREKNVLDLSIAEERYVTVGHYIARALPERAAFVCVLYSGSVRYYAQRDTLRFDWLDADRLEPLLERLEKRGLRPYILLEDWEEPLFRDRFAATSPLGKLDWPPVARLERPTVVSIWDPRDRARHRHGEALATDRIE